MHWFSNLPTRRKLIFSFGLMIMLLAVVTATAFFGIAAIRTDAAIIQDLMAFRSNFNQNRTAILSMLVENDPKERESLKKEIAAAGQENDGILQRLQDSRQQDADFMRKLEELKRIRDEYKEARNTQIKLIDTGKLAEAKVVSLGDQADRYKAIQDITEELQKVAQLRSDNRARQALWIFLSAGGVSLLMGVLLTLSLNRSIADPLREISGVAEKIAVGDLAANVSTNHRADEVGVLAQTFTRMTHSLQQMAGVAEQIAEGDLRVQVKPQSDRDMLGNAFSSMVTNLQRMIADTAEATNVLSASASEISASTTQLAASATETATAVTETTTTVEEIRQTSQVASQKARQVSDTAQQAVNIAQSGKKATEETSAGMQRIREQMEAIAEGMVRLSEQSQAIGAIIATVDDLAQQSNLLAVNASIEAAKAGEQGKGFAVVAQEVKSLADQSKQATMQVRTILSDIQKATSAAVMATEQGSKAVEAGVAQSSQAGEAILTLAENVEEAAQAATQIAASSQQQLVGMDQVVLAMESIKQASGQNVEGAKQLEAAARNLTDLGQRLKQQVEQYKV